MRGANQWGFLQKVGVGQALRACCQSGQAGTANEAGIPGWDGVIHDNNGYEQPYLSGGPFSCSNYSGQAYARTNGTANVPAMIEFNMSRINSVYGNSNTVMPNSINIAIVLYLGRNS